jgi:hypothetical protein
VRKDEASVKRAVTCSLVDFSHTKNWLLFAMPFLGNVCKTPAQAEVL